MTPQPDITIIHQAIDAIRALITNATVLKYFYGYEVQYLPATRTETPSLFISHHQPAAASLLMVFFAEHIGIDCPNGLIENFDENRFGIAIPIHQIQQNQAAIHHITPMVDIYCQALRILRECPDVVQVKLNHNQLAISCRGDAIPALMRLDNIAMVDAESATVPSIFKQLHIHPQALLAQLPMLYAVISDLMHLRQERLQSRKSGQLSLDQLS